MLHKLKTCLLPLSLLIMSSYGTTDFEMTNEKSVPSRAESRELVDTDLKLPGVENAQGRSHSSAGVYVIGNFKTGPQRGRPPKNRKKQQGQAGNNQNQTRRARPRPNRFQVIQILSNNKNKQTNIRLQNGGNRNGGRKGNKRNKNNNNNNNNNNNGGNPSTRVIAPAETISPVTFAAKGTTVLMPVLAFDPNFQDI